MALENMYTNEYWKDLITTITERIGGDAFLRLSAVVLESDYDGLGNELIALANQYTRGTEEEPNYIGKEKDEWKHEAETWQRLKR